MGIKTAKVPGDLVIGSSGKTYRVNAKGVEELFVSDRADASRNRIPTTPPYWIKPRRGILQSLGAMVRRG